MNKYKYLLKNVGLLTISNFGTKLLTFFLVPLYTNVLSTSEYGTYDLFNTTIGLLIPVLTLDIQEAALRFSIDEDSNRSSILKSSLRFVCIGGLCVLIILSINCFFSFSVLLKEFQLLFFLMYFFGSLSSVLSYYVRGIGNVKAVSISGVLSSLVMIVMNIVFLLWLKLGIMGYFCATILGSIVQCSYLLLGGKVRQYLQRDKVDKILQKAMVSYSRPMIANSVAWWINSASDRYIVTWLSGIATNGIYSVAYKIPSIVSVFQTIFGQAWSLSAVKDYESVNNKIFFINIYRYYNCLLCLLCSTLILGDKVIAKLLFANDFYDAWIYAPFLMISTIFSGLAGYFGGVFSAQKNTSIIAFSAVMAAIVNMLLNIFLVWKIGAIGAAVATMISYFVLWLLRWLAVKKDVCFANYKFLFRDVSAYVVLVIQAIFLLIFQKGYLFPWHQILFWAICISLYFDEIRNFWGKVCSKSRVY